MNFGEFSLLRLDQSILIPLKSMSGGFQGFFPLKNPQISHTSQQSLHCWKDLYLEIFGKLLFEDNFGKNGRKVQFLLIISSL